MEVLHLYNVPSFQEVDFGDCVPVPHLLVVYFFDEDELSA